MMNLETVATALGIAGMVFALFLQPLKVQLQNLADAVREVKTIIESYRADMGHITQELAVQKREIELLHNEMEGLKTQVHELGERGCCHVKQD